MKEEEILKRLYFDKNLLEIKFQMGLFIDITHKSVYTNSLLMTSSGSFWIGLFLYFRNFSFSLFLACSLFAFPLFLPPFFLSSFLLSFFHSFFIFNFSPFFLDSSFFPLFLSPHFHSFPFLSFPSFFIFLPLISSLFSFFSSVCLYFRTYFFFISFLLKDSPVLQIEGVRLNLSGWV